jgi:excisionase family DNA binding protein
LANIYAEQKKSYIFRVDWVTQEEAAKILHVALDTMRRWVRQGYFPRTRVGKRYLIPRQAIGEFLESRLEHGPRPVTPRKQKEKEEEAPVAPELQPKLGMPKHSFAPQQRAERRKKA